MALSFSLLAGFGGCSPYPGKYAAPAGYSSKNPLHTVARGETAWSIAQRYGVTVNDLARANGISDISRVETGQRLVIPLRRPVSSSRPVPLPPVSSSGADGPSSSLDGFIWPVPGKVISLFGTLKTGRVNKGVDIQAPAGTEVRAARGGRVSFVNETLPGLGKTIILDHGDGFASVYAHVGEILVSEGERVAQRQVIGRVGRTGRTDVAALHFEIRRNQKPANPLHYLP